MSADQPLTPEELASAYLDGELTVEQVALVEADPAILFLVERFRGITALVGQAPAAPAASLRAQHLDAALAASATSPAVTSLETARQTRQARRFRPSPVWLGAAAAAVVVIAAVPILAQGDGGGDDSADSSAEEATQEAPFEAAEEAAEEAADLGSRDEAGDSTDDQTEVEAAPEVALEEATEAPTLEAAEEATEEALAPGTEAVTEEPASGEEAAAEGGTDPVVVSFELGQVDSVGVILEALRTPPESTASAEATATPNCLVEAQGLGPVGLAGTARLGSTPVEVYRIDAADGVRAVVFETDRCLLVVAQPLDG
jgi:hypothetical protein